MTNGTRQTCEHIDHALAIADIYFAVQPKHWSYEPKPQHFEYSGKNLVFAPDCLCSIKGKLWCIEVQRTVLSRKQFEKKWSIFNLYFEEAFKKADYQNWRSKPDPIVPEFAMITDQKEEIASNGFNVTKRKLSVIKDITSLM